MNSLGDRMKKNYEDRYRIKLTRRMPVMMRLDGRAFHTLTEHCDRPFDVLFSDAMNHTAECLLSEIQGAKCAYIQSDEISILVTDFDDLNTEAWFDYNMAKMCSVAAGMASVDFTAYCAGYVSAGVFDCRVFNVPKEEVCNYFIWRQKDWERNSLQMLAQVHYSHKQLLNKGKAEMHEMLHDKGVNWADLTLGQKNGWFVRRDVEGQYQVIESPVFAENRQAIEEYLFLLSVLRYC